MNLILVLLLLVAAWLLYTITQSYNTMARELREIRMKCIRDGNVSLVIDEPEDPYKQMSGGFISLLQRISAKLEP